MTTISTKRTFAGGVGVASALAAALCVLTLGTSTASAQSLAGSWAGAGMIVYPSGEKERARCRVTFRTAGGGDVSMRAICATASARVIQDAALSRLTGDVYSGEFTNTEYGIRGSIRIKVHSTKKLSASLSGGGGSAHFSLNR